MDDQDKAESKPDSKLKVTAGFSPEQEARINEISQENTRGALAELQRMTADYPSMTEARLVEFVRGEVAKANAEIFAAAAADMQ